jgi:hypothetical protein
MFKVVGAKGDSFQKVCPAKKYEILMSIVTFENVLEFFLTSSTHQLMEKEHLDWWKIVKWTAKPVIGVK